MTIRYNSGDPFGVVSGYDGANSPSNFELPSCGIEDVDKALFDTIDKEVRFSVSDSSSGETFKVPVIFAAGEKWAMLKKGRALRDKTGALILPLITVRRTSIEQNIVEDVAGRGINQQTGELVIKRRLSSLDRNYQNLINKLGISNQTNLSISTSTITRELGQNVNDVDVQDGAWLAPKLAQNIWEIITIPAPQFFTATYEIVFWTQYTLHMNQLVEKLLSSYLPTANGTLRLDSPKGYWFVATISNNQFTAQDNADDMSNEERILRYKFTVKVPGYLVVSKSPGVPSAVRRFVSSPEINFSSGDGVDLVNGISTAKNPYEGADDPTRGFTLEGEIQPNDRKTKQENSNFVRITKNPFSGKERTEYVKIVTKNSKTGETLFRIEDGISTKIVDDS